MSPLLAPFKNLVEEITRLSNMGLRDLVDDLLPEGNDDCAVLRDIAERALVDKNNIRQVCQAVTADIHQSKDSDSNSVRIMTMHKAKGLTSKVVIVAGCCNELIPSRFNGLTNEQRTAEIREQRRLFYVAITRCTKILTLSYFATISENERSDLHMSFRELDQNTQRFNVDPSPLIDELGPAAPTVIEGTEWLAAEYKRVGIDPI